MTTLGAWVSYTGDGNDQNVATALHFVSDSRITIGPRHWDAGRKIFTPFSEPHIFGYCGDVLFPALVLGQIVSAIDQKILFAADASPSAKQTTIFKSIRASWPGRLNMHDSGFQILHGMRTGKWPDTSFALWRIEFTARTGIWDSAEVPIGHNTSILAMLGSGSQSASEHARKWKQSDVGGTSRSIFSAFHDAIMSGDDAWSGGPLQIAALYSSLGPKAIGFVDHGKHFLHGMALTYDNELSNIEWRDALFRRIDPISLDVILKARRYARPDGL